MINTSKYCQLHLIHLSLVILLILVLLRRLTVNYLWHCLAKSGSASNSRDMTTHHPCCDRSLVTSPNHSYLFEFCPPLFSSSSRCRGVGSNLYVRGPIFYAAKRRKNLWVVGAFRNTWQAAQAYFPSFTLHSAHTTHTPINSPPLSGLAHWTDSKGVSVVVQSRLDPCPQRTNERCNINIIKNHDHVDDGSGGGGGGDNDDDTMQYISLHDQQDNGAE